MSTTCDALYELEHFTERSPEFKEEIFRLLFDYAEITTFTAKEKIQYELDMNTEIDRINQLKYARKEGYAEGHKEGREEGFCLMAELLRKKGLSEGEIERTLEEARAL